MSVVPSTRAAARGSSLSASTARAAQPLGKAAARAATPLKVPRAALARLCVTANICPQVLLRTLGLIAQRDIIPLGIAFERGPRRLRYLIDIEGLSPHHADILASKVSALVRVRSVRWVRPRWH
ncbi:hypothetical protein [Sphingomonas montanisoli]|uniref:Uncharacterized protein n=1 Tax=Sphingomonas montanisoli TaxID=2606412 RepID=A0A5D9C298_9SPHN|nr:hypothetical protein [Sphingomonas montanisoli]TZG25759.1 hypothetical protein FYJ91_12235 [Sphingomonas montanisoli]